MTEHGCGTRTPSPTSWHCPNGAENTKPEPESVTIESTHNDRDLRLQY